MKQKILVVCLGNICRSPMAEGLFRHHITRLGLSWEVDSAGTSAHHLGEQPDQRAILCMQKKGIDISGQRSRPFEFSDFEKFDHIFAMDNYNLKDILSKARNDEHKAKVRLMLEAIHPGENKVVPDPWYGDMAGFYEVYDLLDRSIQRSIDIIPS